MNDSPDEPGSALHGRTIAVAESRELEVFATLLERRGARVLRYPLVTILDAPDPTPVLAWLRHFATGGGDDLVLLTGEGLRRLHACLRRHEPRLEEDFLAALTTVFGSLLPGGLSSARARAATAPAGATGRAAG